MGREREEKSGERGKRRGGQRLFLFFRVERVKGEVSFFLELVRNDGRLDTNMRLKITKGVKMSRRDGVSSNLATALIVGSFVGLVIIALVFAYSPFDHSGPSQCGGGESTTPICITSIQLYSGSPSNIESRQNCTGDAQIVVEGENLSNNTYHVSKVVITGGSSHVNATALVPVSNSCLTLKDANPAIPPGFFSFVGYISQPLVFGQEYNYSISFDDGQVQSGALIAQD